MKSKFIVKWSKYFVEGSLKGVMFDSELTFESLDDATRYVTFLHEHSDTPVDAVVGPKYTCHMARIVS